MSNIKCQISGVFNGTPEALGVGRQPLVLGGRCNSRGARLGETRVQFRRTSADVLQLRPQPRDFQLPLVQRACTPLHTASNFLKPPGHIAILNR